MLLIRRLEELETELRDLKVAMTILEEYDGEFYDEVICKMDARAVSIEVKIDDIRDVIGIDSNDSLDPYEDSGTNPYDFV